MNVIVIGGGVIGLGVAWELANRGASVRLLERGRIGEGTTWAAAGILPAARSDTAIDAFDRLRGLSHEAYPAWAAKIESETGIDVGWRRCGGIYLATTPGEAASLVGGLDYWRDLKIDARRVSSERLADRIGTLASGNFLSRLRAAVEVDDECQVRPPDLLRGLAAVCVAAGVRIEESVSVGLRRDGDRAVYEINGENRFAAADAIVLCGGVWTGQAAKAFGLGMSMVPIRGQVLLYRFAERPFECVVNEGHRYLVPRDDGHVLVGSCEEEVGFQLGTTSEGLRMLAQWAGGVLPEIDLMKPVKSWSGLRPATFDGFPMIGAVPQVNNLYVASGHFRSGVHLAPATATLVADLIERKPPSVDPAPFCVGRMVGQRST
jgi:glycine oxidase